MTMWLEDEVGVDLVSHADHVELDDQFAERSQFRMGEHPSHGVVRIAEQEHLGSCRLDLRTERFKVERVHMISGRHSVLDHHPSLVERNGEERRVHGREDEHTVAGLRECQRGRVHRLHDLGHIEDELGVGLDAPAAPAPLCVGKGDVVVGARPRIQVQSRVGDGPHRGVDGWGDAEVHVRDPRREHVGVVAVPLRRRARPQCRFVDIVKIICWHSSSGSSGSSEAGRRGP